MQTSRHRATCPCDYRSNRGGLMIPSRSIEHPSRPSMPKRYHHVGRENHAIVLARKELA